jgi:hypothetical protein
MKDQQIKMVFNVIFVNGVRDDSKVNFFLSGSLSIVGLAYLDVSCSYSVTLPDLPIECYDEIDKLLVREIVTLNSLYTIIILVRDFLPLEDNSVIDDLEYEEVIDDGNVRKQVIINEEHWGNHKLLKFPVKNRLIGKREMDVSGHALLTFINASFDNFDVSIDGKNIISNLSHGKMESYIVKLGRKFIPVVFQNETTLIQEVVRALSESSYVVISTGNKLLSFPVLQDPIETGVVNFDVRTIVGPWFLTHYTTNLFKHVYENFVPYKYIFSCLHDRTKVSIVLRNGKEERVIDAELNPVNKLYPSLLRLSCKYEDMDIDQANWTIESVDGNSYLFVTNGNRSTFYIFSRIVPMYKDLEDHLIYKAIRLGYPKEKIQRVHMNTVTYTGPVIP